MTSKYRQMVVESHPIHREQAVCEEATMGNLISASPWGELAYVMASKREVRVVAMDPSNPPAEGIALDFTLPTTAAITDLEYRQIGESSVLAVGAADGTVKLWSSQRELGALPATGTGPIGQVKFHPSSANLLAVSSHSAISVLDASTLQPVCSVTSQVNKPMSISWSADGAHLIYSSEKSLYLLDPRTGSNGGGGPGVQLVPIAHAGQKFLSCECAREHEVISAGQNSNRDREIALWDVRAGAGNKQSLFRSRIDSSQNFLRARFDPDTSLVYFAGNMDANMRVYESKDGTLAPLGNFTLSGPASSACFAPKNLLAHAEFELGRMLRMGGKSIQQVSVRIPRKPGSAFEDLFPPTRCLGKEALTVQEYLAGRNAQPNLVNLFQQAAVAENVEEEQQAAAPIPEEPTASPEPTLNFSKFLGFQAKMKYNKIVQSNKDQSSFGLSPGDFPGDANLLAASAEFVAFPWKSISGGPLYIKRTLDADFAGKLRGEPQLVHGHQDKISCIQFSEFDQRLLATGAEDATVRVYRLPEHGIATQQDADQLVQSSLRLQGHRLGLRGVAFHRTCANLLTTFASDETIKIWDVESGNGGKELIDLTGLPAAGNVDWNYSGALMAVAFKDSSARVLDPRAGSGTTVTSIAQTHEGLKASRLCWLDKDTLLTTGFGKLGDRQFRLWDLRNPSQYLSSTMLDPGAGVIVPTFVEDNGAVVMTAKGEMTIRVYEVEGLSGAAVTAEGGKYTMHKCNEFRAAGEATLGLAFLPRRFVDYKKAEWLCGYRLTSQTVERLSFQVPRSQEIQGYFYDDLFPPARSGEAAIRSPAEWIKGANVDGPLLVDLNKDKLKVLSERPAAETHQASKRGAASVERMRKEQEERERKELEKKEALDRMQRLAIQHEKYNPNLSQTGQGGHHTAKYEVEVGPSDVQDEEWDD